MLGLGIGLKFIPVVGSVSYLGGSPIPAGTIQDPDDDTYIQDPDDDTYIQDPGA